MFLTFFEFFDWWPLTTQQFMESWSRLAIPHDAGLSRVWSRQDRG